MMTGARDLELLAERYLELWERQLAAMGDDPASPLVAAFIAAAGKAAFGTANEKSSRAAPDGPDTEQ